MNYGPLYGRPVQPYDVIEFFGGAVFNEMVGQAKTYDLGMEVVVCHVFKDSGAKSALNDTVFDSDDAATSCADLMQNVFVDRLQETHVVVCDRQSFFPQFANNLRHDIA